MRRDRQRSSRSGRAERSRSKILLLAAAATAASLRPGVDAAASQVSCSYSGDCKGHCFDDEGVARCCKTICLPRTPECDRHPSCLAMDGGWGSWGDTEDFKEGNKCGRRRRRVCDSPAPVAHLGGRDCQGDAEERLSVSECPTVSLTTTVVLASVAVCVAVVSVISAIVYRARKRNYAANTTIPNVAYQVASADDVGEFAVRIPDRAPSDWDADTTAASLQEELEAASVARRIGVEVGSTPLGEPFLPSSASNPTDVSALYLRIEQFVVDSMGADPPLEQEPAPLPLPLPQLPVPLPTEEFTIGEFVIG